MAAPFGCCQDETSGPYWTGPVAASQLWPPPVGASWCTASGLVAGIMRSCTCRPSLGPGSTAELDAGEQGKCGQAASGSATAHAGPGADVADISVSGARAGSAVHAVSSAGVVVPAARGADGRDTRPLAHPVDGPKVGPVPVRCVSAAAGVDPSADRELFPS